MVTAIIAIFVVILGTYFPSLDNYFHDIDDCIHLDGAIHGHESSPHFRPLQFAWNSLSFQLFGIDPFGYRIVAIFVHFFSAILVANLVRMLTGRFLPAFVAGLTFGVIYAPNEVVMWMAAACSLLVVFFILLACNFHTASLKDSRWRFYWATVVCVVLAMGSKEDCVVLGPILIAIEVHQRSWRSLVSKRAILRYGILLVLGLVYLSAAYRPELWAERSDVGQYDFGLSILPKSIRSLGVFFWPRRIVENNAPVWAFASGVALIAFVLLLAWRDSRRRRSYLFGLAVCFFGMLAVLPGPASIVTKRYVYVSIVGAAILVGLVFDAILDFARHRNSPKLFRLACAAMVVWIGIQSAAIYSIDQYHYGPAGDRTRVLVEGTKKKILPALKEMAGGRGDVIFISPMIWNELDYLPMVSVLAGFSKERLSMTIVPFDDTFIRRFQEGGEASLRTNAIFGQSKDGRIQRIRSIAEVPMEDWRRRAGIREWQGQGATLVWIRFRQ